MKMNAEMIKEKLLEDLQMVDANDPVERFYAATALIEQALHELKHWLHDNPFPGNDEEITFFKLQRPTVLSLQLAESIRYSLIINCPIGTSQDKVRYLEEALKTMQNFLQLNAFYYQYYKNRFKELDQLYFLRSATPLVIPLAEVPDNDRENSTAMSNLFARFMAYEQTQQFILEWIASLSEAPATPANDPGETGLKWTGEIVNLVELAYGLWLTGQLNNGNAGLNQIVRWLQASLDVDMGNVQKKFTEIESRKRISVTKYLDLMKQMVVQKVESDFR